MLVMGKAGKTDTCGYCGEPASQREHVGVLSWKPVLWLRYRQDHGYQEPAVDLFLNPLAAHRWPECLVGPNDSVTDWDPISGEMRILPDGLKCLVSEEPRKSQTQKDIEELMCDPNLRNG